MADGTKIEWTDATWNPVTGCTVVSPGCANCYAMRLAGTRLRHHPSRAGLTHDSKAGPVWNGRVSVNWQWFDQPLTWARPRMIFVCAHGDLFHVGADFDVIAQVYGIMIAAHHLRGHRFQVLTKRIARARKLLNSQEFWDRANAEAGAYILDRVDPLNRRSNDARATCGKYGLTNPPPGIWLGTSVEDQPRADERLDHLRATPAAIRFVSFEPLLGPVTVDLGGIHWSIVGGESGPGARPMHPDWARSLRDQCVEARVPFFFKQWGEWVVALDREHDDPDWRADYGRSLADHGTTRWLNLGGGCGFHGERFHVMRSVGKKAAGRMLDGTEHNGFPTERVA